MGWSAVSHSVEGLTDYAGKVMFQQGPGGCETVGCGGPVPRALQAQGGISLY